MNAVAIIVAAGAGSRFGSSTPKQFLTLGAWPVWRWSYQVFKQHPRISDVLIVVPEGGAGQDFPSGIKTVQGGKTRSQSVLNGLEALNISPETPVLIHDAARPGLTPNVIEDLLSALDTAAGAAPALPVNDALKRGTTHLETVNRSDIHRVQTPQAFKLGDIKAALKSGRGSFVDDLEAIERAGGTIALVKGTERLFKITQPGDIQWLERLLVNNEVRIGSGFDVHAFEPGDHVTLCGVDIPHSASLKGHSDADAAWHALTDAILGALSLGDIGDHFPPSDSEWKNAASSIFLKHAAKLAYERGFTIKNIDITLICEQPKIKPHRDMMRQSTANCLGIAMERVSVKATTTEGLGFTGRGEGLAAQASVILAGHLTSEE